MMQARPTASGSVPPRNSTATASGVSCTIACTPKHSGELQRRHVLTDHAPGFDVGELRDRIGRGDRGHKPTTGEGRAHQDGNR